MLRARCGARFHYPVAGFYEPSSPRLLKFVDHPLEARAPLAVVAIDVHVLPYHQRPGADCVQLHTALASARIVELAAVVPRVSSSMDHSSPEQHLREEGFRHVYIWQDGPNAFYADHTHAVDTAHVILEGELTLTCGGSTTTYAAGERPPDVPAGAVHSARMGPQGCRYLIGEK